MGTTGDGVMRIVVAHIAEAGLDEIGEPLSFCITATDWGESGRGGASIVGRIAAEAVRLASAVKRLRGRVAHRGTAVPMAPKFGMARTSFDLKKVDGPWPLGICTLENAC